MGSFILQIQAVNTAGCAKHGRYERENRAVIRSMEQLHSRAGERSFLPYSWPQVYHNSFWRNYFTNYWQPGSTYYNSFTLPSSYTMSMRILLICTTIRNPPKHIRA